MAASMKFVSSGSDSDVEEEKLLDVMKKDVCSLCAVTEAKYTCPRCNVQYCSLSCYKSKKHEGCSESFYRQCVLEEMEDQTVGAEDRKKIMEMLQREQEQFAEESDEAEGEEETPSLNERMEGLDLDKDTAEVWRRLTQQEREEFAHMLKDGRLSKLVTVWTPWWMTKDSGTLVQEGAGDRLPAGFPAHLSDIPDINLILKSKPSSDIKYNLINVISAYVFVTRLHNGDHHEHALQCTEELLQVSGVLGSNTNYSSVKDASYAVILDIQKDKSQFVVPASFPVVLIGDVIRILQGTRLSPLSAVLSALSDTAVLFKEANKDLRKNSKGRKKTTGKTCVGGLGSDKLEEESSLEKQLFLVKKKVMFLLGWTQRYGMCLSNACAELSLELECLKSEMAETKLIQKEVEKGLKAGSLKPQSPTNKIEELT